MPSNTQLDPVDLDDLGGNLWDHARREYLAGVTAVSICQRYGVSLSSFRLHARVGGWRRIDQPAGDVAPEPGEYHPDDNVSFADLAEEAFLNIRRALGAGRAAEASSWMRLYDKLADRARAQVMAGLPDLAPPRLESRFEPLQLVAVEEANINNMNDLSKDSGIESQALDSLHPIFLESDPASPAPLPLGEGLNAQEGVSAIGRVTRRAARSVKG